MKTEKILVIPREGSIKPYLKDGGHEFSLEDLKEVLVDGVYGTRYLMEENFNFKQIIPYIAFISNNKVLVYKRSSKSGEGRLHDKYSLGVGGHVDLEADESKLCLQTVFDAAIREVEEELGVIIRRDELNVAFSINDDSDEVGKVHFGIGFVINKDVDLDKGEQDILVERKFMGKQEINQIYDNLETWSQLFYEKHVKNLIE